MHCSRIRANCANSDEDADLTAQIRTECLVAQLACSKNIPEGCRNRRMMICQRRLCRQGKSVGD